MTATIHHGEALVWLRSLATASADALVTDPPAGIGFMGKGWDRDRGGRTAWIAWLAEILGECRRVMKPGAAGWVWALPRTSHWTATACEDAGFEVRDVVTHVQGQGFPKSKALLKPASEHWILVRNPGPLRGLRIDECRVGHGEPEKRTTRTSDKFGGVLNGGRPGHFRDGDSLASASPAGRWPANFAMSHCEGCDDACEADCPVRLLGEQSGESKSKAGSRGSMGGSTFGSNRKWESTHRGHDDSGTAARFFPCFYQPKASKRDRGDGNTHPTVKSIALMRWLCRLVTPAGGLVLDPFSGSGTTGVAALQEGLRFAGCEREAEYVEIARARVAHAAPRPLPTQVSQP